MSRSHKSAIRNTVLFLALAGVCVYAGLSVKKIVSIDSLKRFRDPLQKGDNAGMVMPNFDWKAFNGSTLVASAHVKKATVGSDHDQTVLDTVSNGKYFEKGKVAFGFEAQSAVYYDAGDSLVGNGKSRVFNDQMDISTTSFHYDPNKKALIVPAPIIGKLHGGDVKAGTLTYKLDDKSVALTGVTWSGMIAQDDKKSNWHFSGPKGGSDPIAKSLTQNKITTMSKLMATDGEIIVMADSAVYDQDADVLTAKGNVKYFGSDANMTCAQVVVYRKEKRAVLSGVVDMLIKPKQDGKAEQVTIPPVTPVVPESILKDRPKAPPTDDKQTDTEKQVRSGDNIRDYPVAVTASKIEYWYKKGEKKAIITGSPQARQEFPDGAWRMVWAESGFYDGEKETLNLKSKGDKADVRMLNSVGDDMTATSVLVSTKEGDDMLDAENSVATIKVHDEDLPDKTKGGGTGGSPPPISGPIKKAGGH